MALDCSHNATGLAFIVTQEFLVTYCLTFVFFILCVVPFRVQFVDISQKLCRFNIFPGIFMKTLCVWNITIDLYRAAHECRHSKVPTPKLQKEKRTQDQQPPLSAPPPKDEFLEETQPQQTLVIRENLSLLAPQVINEPERKEIIQSAERSESPVETTPVGTTHVSQVTPSLGIMPSENTRIQHRDTQEDISDILGTRVYKRYEDTPLQMLDGIIMNQPK